MVIGFDGCHLKGNQKGYILSIVGIDSNNEIFPIPYSVVKSECKDSWLWFLELLKEDLELDD